MKSLGLDLAELQRSIRFKDVPKFTDEAPRWSHILKGSVPFTPDAKRVLEFAMEEAGNLGHDYIGDEHLILGLIKVEPIASIVRSAGIESEDLRAAILEFLGGDGDVGDDES